MGVDIVYSELFERGDWVSRETVNRTNDQKPFCQSHRYSRVGQRPNVEAGLHRNSRGDSRRGSHTVLLFFVLTYIFTWTCWLPVVTGRISTTRPAFGFLWLLGVFGPAAVAVGLTAGREGNRGVRALLAKIFLADVGARWYIFAITYMVGDQTGGRCPFPNCNRPMAAFWYGEHHVDVGRDAGFDPGASG